MWDKVQQQPPKLAVVDKSTYGECGLPLRGFSAQELQLQMGWEDTETFPAPKLPPQGPPPTTSSAGSWQEGDMARTLP